MRDVERRTRRLEAQSGHFADGWSEDRIAREMLRLARIAFGNQPVGILLEKTTVDQFKQVCKAKQRRDTADGPPPWEPWTSRPTDEWPLDIQRAYVEVTLGDVEAAIGRKDAA